MKPCTDPSRSRQRGLAGFGGLAAACLVVAATSRCVTDHDALAKRDRDAAVMDDASAGGTGNAPSSSGGGGSTGHQGGTAGKYVEPTGSNVVTFMHGVVDAEQVVFCFARDDGGDSELVGEPAPANGLEFGQSFSVEALPDLDLEEDAIQPFVIGGDLELLEGLDCEESVALAEELMALAMPMPSAGEGGAGGEGGATEEPEVPLPDPPDLRVRALPVLPASTVSGGYSYLLVAEGCLGGPWYVLDGAPSDDDDGAEFEDDDICGDGYSGGDALAPALVVLSRETGRGVGLQVLHASRGSGVLELQVAPPPGSPDFPFTVARDLVEGALEPQPALTDRLGQEYGVDDALYRVEILNSSGGVASEPWQTLLDRAGIEALEDGKNYALVALGPRVDIGVSTWWNLPTIGLVPAEPE